MEKGEMPPQFKKKKEEMSEKKDKEMPEKAYKADDEEKEEKDDKKKSEFSDVITAEYLDWMENTLKSAGVNTDEARAHFDGIAKANLGSTPEELSDYDTRFAAQVKGRAQEGGSPSTNALSRAGLSRGGGEVSKSDFITSVDPASMEHAYDVFKAAKQEEELRKAMESNFESRYAQESAAELAKAQAQNFDARGPLDEIMKSLSALNERIDNISSGEVQVGTTIAKSAPTVEVPSTQDLANMTWDEVHQLAGGLFRDE